MHVLFATEDQLKVGSRAKIGGFNETPLTKFLIEITVWGEIARRRREIFEVCNAVL